MDQALEDAERQDAPHVSAASSARELGVSAATGSYALNGKPGVSDQMRRKILKLANESGLRPGPPGTRTSALTRVIALIVPNLTNPMFPHWSPQILDVAHIEPDSEGGAASVANVRLLCANHHRAFDRGLLIWEPQQELFTQAPESRAVPPIPQR